MSENENSTLNANPAENNQPNEEAPKKELTREELEAELRRVRNEAASRRITNRELEEKAKRWEEYEESQKSELQRLQDALAERDRKLSDYQLEQTKRTLVDEYGLDKDDLELLVGSDEESNRKIAERLKAKNEKIANATPSRPADLLAGNRGTPVGSTNNSVSGDASFDAMLRSMARRQ